MSNTKDLTFANTLNYIKQKTGEEEWITAYFERKYEDFSSEYVYCALIPESEVSNSLQNNSWDLSIGEGMPHFGFCFKEGQEIPTYHRFSYKGVEPLIIWRNFHGIREGYWDISEEFRHYFNLYDDRKNNRLTRIDENGDESDAVILKDDKILIKNKLVKEFLSLKKMRLALFFDYVLYSRKSLDDLGLKEYSKHITDGNICYSIGVSDCSDFGYENKSIGYLMGKKVLEGLNEFKPTLRQKRKNYADFIIGIDSNGDPITFTSDEDKLANFFGKNPRSPNYLTPIFFRKEVLTKYYSQPNKYSVVDGGVSCGDLWSLRIDNNHSDYVMVFLGDLGHLAYIEQLYWKTFNIPMKGKMSYTAWARGFEGTFADPERSDLLFKNQYEAFQEKWKKKFGWALFINLSDEDKYHWKSLRIPLTNEQKEFDEQILSLTKLIIDSLNEKKLAKGLILEPCSKGISKLEAFLTSKGAEVPQMIHFLRNLQSLRSSGVAHLKGKTYTDLKKEFGIGEKDLPEVFDRILFQAILFLNTIEKSLLLKDNL